MSLPLLHQIGTYLWAAILRKNYEGMVILLHIPEDGALFAIEDNRVAHLPTLSQDALNQLSQLERIKPLVNGVEALYATAQSRLEDHTLYCNLLDQNYPQITPELKEQLMSLVRNTTMKRKSRSMRFTYHHKDVSKHE